MKDLLHYDEWRKKGIEYCIVSEGNSISTTRINVYWQKPTIAQEELYKYLKTKLECGEQPNESEIFVIYQEYAAEEMRFTGNPECDDQRIATNARNWFRSALSSLVLLGWFGLQFKKTLK